MTSNIGHHVPEVGSEYSPDMHKEVEWLDRRVTLMRSYARKGASQRVGIAGGKHLYCQEVVVRQDQGALARCQ